MTKVTLSAVFISVFLALNLFIHLPGQSMPATMTVPAVADNDQADTLPPDNPAVDAEGLAAYAEGEPTIANFWDLIKQAGPIRYPIFGIFFVGVFLITLKTIELIIDKRQSAVLENADIRKMKLPDFAGLVSKQSENMMSRIMSTLLNVFQTSRNTEFLHDEVANYARYQQDNFNTFRTRLDFLSDTAGALGLLGTVWGMFIVFSSGSLEREIILTGMGIALLTTLLGLIVSIALNFSTTLAHSFFSRRLEEVLDHAEKFRFRLLEIAEKENHNNHTVKTGNHVRHAVAAGAAVADGFGTSYEEEEVPETETEMDPVVPEAEPEPALLDWSEKIDSAVPAGTLLKNIGLRCTDASGERLEGVPVRVSLTEGSGSLDGKGREIEIRTDSNGTAFFSWQAGSKAGSETVEARVKDSNDRKLTAAASVNVLPGEPDSIRIINNNQSGPAGKKLKKPLITEISDRFGNPAAGCNVHLEVTQGGGKLGYGKESVVLQTDKNGQANTSFTLGSEPGFNVVDVSVKKSNLNARYQAMGIETQT